MVRADLRKAEGAAVRAQVGRCLARAQHLAGWSLKELADALQRDERQVARWISGAERVQLDAVCAVPRLRAVFLVALAEFAGVDVVTHDSSAGRRMTVTAWDQLPLILHASHMADLFGLNVHTIWRRCAARTMRPAPLGWARPYLWAREAVRQELEAVEPSKRRAPRVAPAVVTGRIASRQDVEAARARLLGAV